MGGELVVADLVKRYANVVALAGVSFAAAAGEIVGLLGRNGAGKTTAVECIVGLRRPDGGSVSVCGVDAAAEPRRARRLIGAQLQQMALQDKITPREAIELFAALYGVRCDPTAVLKEFSLIEKADAAFDTLSGGQKQRLGLALAMVHGPAVIILDEPTAGLDVQGRRELHAHIRTLRGEGKAILFTTHLIEEAEELCDRIVVIERGRVVGDAAPTALIEKTKTQSLEEAFIALTA